MTPETARRRRAPAWAQWTAAAFASLFALALLTLLLLAGLNAWRPGQRVAQAPSLALERAIGPSTAGRMADDDRVRAR